MYIKYIYICLYIYKYVYIYIYICEFPLVYLDVPGFSPSLAEFCQSSNYITIPRTFLWKCFELVDLQIQTRSNLIKQVFMLKTCWLRRV